MSNSFAPESTTLPYVVEAPNDSSPSQLIEYFAANSRECEDLLVKHGGLLFRNFSVSSPGEFEHCANAFFGGSFAKYMDGTSPRTRVHGGVYTSTEYPAEYFISLHNELSYSHKWPKKIAFCCSIAPLQGGETPIIDSRKLLRALPPALVGVFREKGVCYVRNLHGGTGIGLSWQAVFETKERSVVETHCREGGIEFLWKDDGSLKLTQIRAATAIHPDTGEEVWFNQADQFHPTEMDSETRNAMLEVVPLEDFPKNACFGDGTPIADSMLDVIRSTTRRQMVRFPWHKGDFLLLDNMLVAHGRMPFDGPRKILVAMN